MEITKAQLLKAARVNPEGLRRLAKATSCAVPGERVDVTARRVADKLERERVAVLRASFLKQSQG